ncbi:hypothetical protein [Alloacidobacterium sp.]|uniref:hypothetical protein n=1 Tax=Alloacidobacterium sp. TaxID=2951999 RepID=UPI002D4C61C8|nr:hypothetical protein [Alloacidobacterium sp.]HYK35268.1 hypothetical protein [Alloacidobacterium sp.]
MLRTDTLPEIARFELSKEEARVEELGNIRDRLDEKKNEIEEEITKTKRKIATAGGGAYEQSLKDDADAMKAELDKMDKEWDRLWDREIELKRQIKLWENPEFIRWHYLAEAQEGAFKHVHISWWPPSEGVGHEIKEMRGTLHGSSNSSAWEDLYSEMSKKVQLGLQAGKLKARDGQVNLGAAYGLKNKKDEPDKRWGQEPDWVISVPALGSSNRYFGVNAARMWMWFTNYRDQSVGADYKMISKSKSCAGIAMRALKQGGGDAFTRQPVSQFYVLPNEVAQYAIDLRAAIVELNTLAARFEFTVLQSWIKQHRGTTLPSGGAQPHKKPELWTADWWRKNRQPHARGFFSMGDLLEEYHSLDAKKDWAAKFRVVGKIFSNSVDEIEDEAPIIRPTPRIESLIIVCAQCLNVIRNPQSWART